MITLYSNWNNRWKTLQRINKARVYDHDFCVYFATYSDPNCNLWPYTLSDGWGIGDNS